MYVALAVWLKGAAPIPDEIAHYGQINRFDHGDFRIALQYLTMVPGYHALMAAILWTLDLRSLDAARLLNALLGLGTIGAFHLARSALWSRSAAAATLQFALLPILLPYDFLVYTDVLALGLVLAALAATLRDRHLLAGLVMVGALCVRQTSVVWLPLLAAIAVWPADGKLPALREVARRGWPYALGVLLFLGYWLWNGHISLSPEQAAMHPDLSMHVGNIFFALFLCALLLPLQVAVGLRRFATIAVQRPWVLALPLAAFAAFWALFQADHPYNLATTPLMLHNLVVQQVQADGVLKMVFGVAAVLAGCGLAPTVLRPRGAVLLYPVAIFALAAFWMIEPRYALVPLAFWLVFREPARHANIEYATMALWALFAVCMCFGIHSGRFSL